MKIQNVYNIKKIIYAIIFASFINSCPVSGQSQNQWEADWITLPGISGSEYGVYIFRKVFVLENVPDLFPVYISADNQYKLYINEELISVGPARSDIEHWNYETVDLAPYLQSGQNLVAVKVWNFGEYKAEAQISLRTGFILQGATPEAEILNTNETWKCEKDNSYTPINISAYGLGEVNVNGYYVAGPGERVDMYSHIKEFQKLSYNDSSWEQAVTVFQRKTVYSLTAIPEKKWTIRQSLLPAQELTYQRLKTVRKTEGITVPSSFPSEKISIQVPSNTTATILLDQEFLTNAFPTLVFSGGEKSTITLTWAEALYDGPKKDNRNVTEGKTMVGRKDIIISDGTTNQTFTSLTYRTYRYVELKIETKNTPLVIEDLYGTFTGYPFQLNAILLTENTELQKIFEIGWRTARLCALDTYMDCPFYEQLQYIGDTRIQAMISYYNSGDDRLIKNALNLMDYSRQPDGITLSRYPTASENQVIPPFSLFYIGMLHDYMMYGSDSLFIINKLSGARQVMNYFIRFLASDGSLKHVPDWNFTDWASGWTRGVPPTGKDGNSAVLDLQLLLALQSAADLEQNLGRKEFAGLYNELAGQLTKTIQEKYWDNSRKLYADTPEKEIFSQHTNTLAILTGLVKGEEAKMTGSMILSDTTLTQASIYFKYYVHQALVKAGLGDDYLNWLGIWRKNLELGMTTWGEDSQVESTRSDCHAWGASPNIEIFRTILGIESDAPGFKKIRVEPHLGNITEIGGRMPHPEGIISVNYDLKSKKPVAEIILPENVSGTFIWKGVSHDLAAGKNILYLN